MSGAPAEVWLRPSDSGRFYAILWEPWPRRPDTPAAVRYVRADLYEALLARAQQEPLGEVGKDYLR